MPSTAESNASVRRNDYGALTPPTGEWTPRLSVSVVVPAQGQQERLDVVLAALAAQSYPEELLEVLIVDDGSDPKLRLPELRPAHARIVRPLPGGWASAHATNSGVEHGEGDVVLRLDSDMLAFTDHVESQMRWHHTADYLAVLGHKRFVDYRTGDLEPREVYDRVKAGDAASLFRIEDSDPQWVETIIDHTDGLKDADHRAFRVLVGATFSVSRALYRASGGMDEDVILGSDTIFGYRLHQAGAVFVPDSESSSWHLGPRQIASRGDLAKRYRRPRIANRVPELDLKRPRAARGWDTPLASVFIEAGPGAETCVDKILTGTVPDVRVTLLGEWPKPQHRRHAPLDDPDLEARLLIESFRGEPRVHLASEADDDPTVPYRIWLPAEVEPRKDTVEALIAHANKARLGRLDVVLPEGTASLVRTAALARAAHLGADIAEVWGAERVTEGPLVDTLRGAAPSAPSAVEGPSGRSEDGLARRVLRRLRG